jgi:hypothetical protein
MIKDSNKYTADSTADGAFYASMGQLAVALISTGGTSGKSGLESLYDLFKKMKGSK